MKITLQQNKTLHSLLSATGLLEDKAELVQLYSKSRTSSARELTSIEANNIISHLRKFQGPKKENDPANKMRRKIIHQMRTIGYETPDRTADMKAIYSWVEQYGYLHKHLNSYTLEELPRLVSQVEEMYKKELNRARV